MRTVLLTMMAVAAILTIAPNAADAYSVFSQIDKADVICLATYDSVSPAVAAPAKPAATAGAAAAPAAPAKAAGTTPVPTAHAKPDATAAPPVDEFTEQPPLAEFDVNMHVVQVWKGSAPTEKIVLKTTARQWNATQQVRVVNQSGPFDAHALYLVFARRQMGSAVLAQIDPIPMEDMFVGAVPVPQSAKTINPDAPIVQRVTRAMIECLGDPDPRVRSSARGLTEFKWLFIDGAKAPRDLPSGAHPADIKAGIIAGALPKLIDMTSSKDPALRLEGLTIAAQLQQTQVIPILSAIAEGGAADANQACALIGDYFNKSAVPDLIPLLKNKNPLARRITIQTLEMREDRRALPYLIDALDDTDMTVSTAALDALFHITGLPTGYTTPQKSTDSAGYVKFWKDWADSHDDDLDSLRKQAGASAGA